MTQHFLCLCARRVAAAIILGATCIPASAQAPFPSSMIRLVSPTSVSTPPDIISRIIASELSESEGWRVVVENRPGGITTIAAVDVLGQPADGHTIYVMSVPSVAAPSLVQNISYRIVPKTDLAGMAAAQSGRWPE
jgi:tripartite-type tricarboxylate transporter receptor subunit TctC